MENKAQAIVSKHNDFRVMLDLNLGMQDAEKTCTHSKKFYFNNNNDNATYWLYVFDDQSLLQLKISNNLRFNYQVFDSFDQCFVWKNV